MNVHASPSTLPELDEFLSTFNIKFRRSEGETALERYLTGLLTELPNKNWLCLTFGDKRLSQSASSHGRRPLWPVFIPYDARMIVRRGHAVAQATR